MTPFPPDEGLRQQLQARVGKVHLQQRLGIERDYERRIFGQGRNFFHIENWSITSRSTRGRWIVGGYVVSVENLEKQTETT